MRLLSLYIPLMTVVGSLLPDVQATPVPSLTVATYNSKFLSACMAKERQKHFHEVVRNLHGVDVVALQEVRDRFAAEHYFKPDSWTVIIDDDSTDDMNLAYAVRKGLPYTLDSENLINADSQTDFAFPDGHGNFIDSRRLLKLNISTEFGDVMVLNHHAKSRYNGRTVTDQQRINAALDIVDYLDHLPNKKVILLGDFNDTPDDASTNTLELGRLSARELENSKGAYLINLTEPLAAEDNVSYGLKNDAKTGAYFQKVNSVVVGSRQANLDNFESDVANTHGLYDQIFISTELAELYGNKSFTRIFEHTSAIVGNQDTRASDHVPVLSTLGTTGRTKPDIIITSLLPNPIGSDTQNETITLRNQGPDYLGGLLLRDASQSTSVLEVSLPSRSELTITIPSGVTLNNSGDTISLFDEYEQPLDSVSYSSCKEGIEITFKEEL
ncbi:endonuclease/exonuclease/phosphatase family protein [Vibrio mimicus]